MYFVFRANLNFLFINFRCLCSFPVLILKTIYANTELCTQCNIHVYMVNTKVFTRMRAQWILNKALLYCIAQIMYFKACRSKPKYHFSTPPSTNFLHTFSLAPPCQTCIQIFMLILIDSNLRWLSGILFLMFLLYTYFYRHWYLLATPKAPDRSPASTSTFRPVPSSSSSVVMVTNDPFLRSGSDEDGLSVKEKNKRLDALAVMFPQYDKQELQTILEQADYSLDTAIDLLQDWRRSRS